MMVEIMKIFTVDAPLDSGEKKTAIASTQLAMTPAYKVVEKKKKGGSTLLKAALFVVFAFLLAAVLTVVISEYAWKKREGGNLFRMRWEDIRSKFQNRPSTFEAQPIPVQIDDPSPPVPAEDGPQIVLLKPDEEAEAVEVKPSPLIDLAKMDLLRTLVERIRQHHQQQQMNMAEGDGDTIAVIAVQPLEGHGPFPMSGEHSAEEMGGNREPAIIDDPMDIPIQIHPPMTPPHHRAGGPSRPFGPWPSDDYYNNVPFYPDYHQYPDSPTDGFEGHHGPRHNGPPPPPFDAREFFNGPEPHYPDFSPEQFANGPPPPPFDHRGPRNGPRRPFNRPPPPDYSDFADGPFAGRNGPPPPPFDHHSIDYPSDGPNGLNDGPFGGPPPPPHFGSFQGPPPAFGSFGGPEGPREEQSGSQQQPTIRITQHFTDKESDRPTSIVTEIFGGKKMERMVGEIIANSAMSGMNAIEQPQEGQNDQLLPPWMQRQFGPNTVDPAMIQGSPNGNPFFPAPNQMQMFNPFQAMNEIQYRPEGAMNQFNFAPPEISQQQFEMNLNQAQPPVQSAPFFHGANFMQQQQQTGQFRPEMAPFFAQNDQNEMMFANGAFPMGNNQQQGAQQPSGMGNGVMFPQVVMPPENQMDSEQRWFNPLELAAAGLDASNERMGQPPMDNLDPRMMMQPHNAPRPVDLNPEMQHWNEEMLQRNQHQFEGMTPEVFAASLNIAPDMAPQQSAEPEQQEKPQPPPPGATVLGMDFSDRGPAFTPPKPPMSGQDSSETVVAEGGLENVPLFPASPAVVHVEAPQEGGPPAVAPQEPSVAVHSQDIPQPPPVWSHPSEPTPHQDTPILSRSDGFGKAK